MLESHGTFHTANSRRQVLIADDEALNRDVLGVVLGDDYDLLYAEARRFPDEAVTACGMADYIPGEDSRFQNVFERADRDMYENKKKLKNTP